MAIGPDGMWYMTPEEQKISDAIDAYERALLDQFFPNRYKRGYIGWSTHDEGDPRGIVGHMLIYDWTFERIHADYQGGP